MADRRCWKCKQPFGPFERPMDFTYDGTTITRHDDCVPALMRGIEAAVEAVRGLVEACEAFNSVWYSSDPNVYEDAREVMAKAARSAKEVLRG